MSIDLPVHQCINFRVLTRTEEDFVDAMRALVETDPEASWTFVCDGLNTHKPESLVRFIAQQRGLTEDLGIKGKSGIGGKYYSIINAMMR